MASYLTFDDQGLRKEDSPQFVTAVRFGLISIPIGAIIGWIRLHGESGIEWGNQVAWAVLWILSWGYYGSTLADGLYRKNANWWGLIQSAAVPPVLFSVACTLLASLLVPPVALLAIAAIITLPVMPLFALVLLLAMFPIFGAAMWYLGLPAIACLVPVQLLYRRRLRHAGYLPVR